MTEVAKIIISSFGDIINSIIAVYVVRFLDKFSHKNNRQEL